MTEFDRRKFIKGSLAGLSAPFILGAKKPVLRVLGTHVTLQEKLRQMAMKDLNIELQFEAQGSAAVLQKAAANPKSFDLYEQWSDSINVLWQAKAIQPIDVKELKYWSEINELPKTGKISPKAKLGAGDSPNKILFVQEDGSLGTKDTGKISFMPYVHNTDSFGYNTQKIPKGVAYETESWAWLLDEKYKGKVGLVNAPTIGVFDAALAAQGAGLMEFQDIGNMTVAEIDKLFTILKKKKQEGHFSGFWTSVPRSVEFMASDRVWLQSMFSPGVSAINGRGVPVTYAAPKEGYRAWYGVMCMSSKISNEAKEAAYKYMNWWLSGQPGAFIARQGYYISNPERSRALMSKEEWDYWYEGKVAQKNLRGTDDKVCALKGTFRDGGSYVQRFNNIAVWNTVMDNYDYSLDKWYELLNA